MGKILIKIPLLIIEGIKLFFILPLSVCSKRQFTHFWNKYHTIPWICLRHCLIYAYSG